MAVLRQARPGRVPAPRVTGPGFRTLAYTAAALTFVLIIVGGVVSISDSCAGGREAPEPAASGLGAMRAIRTLAICSAVAVLATIVAGGYMSANELHGTPQEATAVDPHTACGTDFPSCGGEFMPFGRSRAIDIHLTHRAFMYIASTLVIALFLTVLRQRRRLAPDAARRLTRASGANQAVLLTQVTLGALNV